MPDGGHPTWGDRSDPNSWRWSPREYPRLPERVSETENVQGQLVEDSERIMKAVRWASRAGWLIAAELAWIIVRGVGL